MVKRDESGKFVKGHTGGPGRPKKEREQRFLEITLSEVTFDDWRDIIRRAVSDAKKGDPAARKFLADYLIGPPVQKNELTGANGGPIAMTWADFVKGHGGNDSTG